MCEATGMGELIFGLRSSAICCSSCSWRFLCSVTASQKRRHSSSASSVSDVLTAGGLWVMAAIFFSSVSISIRSAVSRVCRWSSLRTLSSLAPWGWMGCSARRQCNAQAGRGRGGEIPEDTNRLVDTLSRKDPRQILLDCRKGDIQRLVVLDVALEVLNVIAVKVAQNALVRFRFHLQGEIGAVSKRRRGSVKKKGQKQTCSLSLFRNFSVFLNLAFW